MPLPFVLIGGAVLAGAVGTGAIGHGIKKIKDASVTMQETINRNKANLEKCETKNKRTMKIMDRLGKREMEILNSFDEFIDIIGKIQNCPEFNHIEMGKVKIPKYEMEEIKKVSVGAGVLLGGLGGAVGGTAGGFAAAGAVASAVMALGTASTGTAIASLSGVAATNATLAALGGGALATGGGGIALGTTVLGISTLGAALLVGGIIFNVTGSKLSSRADEAYAQMLQTEENINLICDYLQTLSTTGNIFFRYLNGTAIIYKQYLDKIKFIINDKPRINWDELDYKERLTIQNTVLLVGLLYQMCKVNLVTINERDDTVHIVNKDAVYEAVDNAKLVIAELKKY